MCCMQFSEALETACSNVDSEDQGTLLLHFADEDGYIDYAEVLAFLGGRPVFSVWATRRGKVKGAAVVVSVSRVFPCGLL